MKKYFVILLFVNVLNVSAMGCETNPDKAKAAQARELLTRCHRALQKDTADALSMQSKRFPSIRVANEEATVGYSQVISGHDKNTYPCMASVKGYKGYKGWASVISYECVDALIRQYPKHLAPTIQDCADEVKRWEAEPKSREIFERARAAHYAKHAADYRKTTPWGPYNDDVKK